MDVISLKTRFIRSILANLLERTLRKRYDIPSEIQFEELEYADNGAMTLVTLKARIKLPSAEAHEACSKLLKLEDTNG